MTLNQLESDVRDWQGANRTMKYTSTLRIQVDARMTIQVEVNSVLFSSFVYDGRTTKLPQLLAPTFRHAKGSFHTLLLGWALPLSLRDFSYQQSSQGSRFRLPELVLPVQI